MLNYFSSFSFHSFTRILIHKQIDIALYNIEDTILPRPINMRYWFDNCGKFALCDAKIHEVCERIVNAWNE